MSKVEANEYTESAKRDVIYNFLKDNKELRNILHKFTGRPSGTFLFNPMGQDLIFEWFLQDAEGIITQTKIACIQLICGWGGERLRDSLVKNFTVQISDSNEIKMQDWNAEYEGVPVSVNVQVIGAFNEETYTKSAYCACPECQHGKEVFDLSIVPRCTTDSCTLKGTLMMVRKETLKTGPIKTIMIQEPLEEAKHSAPKIFPCIIKDDDVAATFIGQRKKIIAIFRSEPQKGKPTNRIMIHAISVHSLGEVDEIQPTDEEMEKFMAMSKQDNYVSKIVDSYAPEVRYGGTELAKLCLILSILGGNKIGRLRGYIHAFLVGDPSTAKSKMLEFMPMVVQKSGFAVGGTASGSGITVAMDTLPNRMKMPRAGLIPNCTGGCAAIDELNQLEDEDLGKVFEAMESGTIHYNKGGFDVLLVAETAIMAGANPRGYYYNKSKSIVDNIHMPGPLIARFDLKILLQDNDNTVEERNILNHISLIRDIGVEKYVDTNALLQPRELMVLFNLARSFTPKMSKEAEKLITDFHMMMKTLPQDEGSFRIDKRFFEAIGRICIAYAKLHFKKTVTKEMAMIVIEIYKRTLKTFGMNVESGEMQLSLEESGKTKETAFVFVFKDKQLALNETFLQEEVVVKGMAKNYPRFWKNATQAGDYFRQMDKSGKLNYRGGRYNLI